MKMASGNQYFNTNEALWAYETVLQAKFTPGSDMSKKLMMIMDNMQLMSNVRNELTTGSNATLKKWEMGVKKYASPYALMQSFEFVNQATTAVAVLKNMGLWDKFDKDGHIDGVDLAKVAMKIDNVNTLVHGDYRNALMMDKSLLTQMFMTFKRALAMGVYNRISKETYNGVLGQYNKGTWLSFADFVKANGDGASGYLHATLELGKQLGRKILFQNTTFGENAKLSAVDVANMRKNATDIMWFATSTTMMLMLRTLIAHQDNDDKTKELSTFWLNRMVRLQGDLSFMMNPDFWNNLGQNSIPMLQMYAKTGKVMTDVVDLLTGGDNEYHTGAMRGQSKFARHFLDLLPYSHAFINVKDNFLNDYNKGGFTGIIQKNFGSK